MSIDIAANPYKQDFPLLAANPGLAFLDSAATAQRPAVALDAQESAALLVHYGDILKALGENFMAEIYWRKALEKGYDAGRIERRITESKAKKE